MLALHAYTTRLLWSRARLIEDVDEKSPGTEALMRAVLSLFEKIVKLSRNLSEESYVAAMNVDEPGWLADLDSLHS